MEPVEERAERLAKEYLRKYYGCSQTTLAAVADALGIDAEQVFKSMIGLAGGVGITGWGTCGALTGAAAAISLYLGPDRREYENTPEIRFKIYELCWEVAEKFKERFGGVTCWEVQRKLFGRHFDLRDSSQLREFLDKGYIWRCDEVTGSAARWAVEAIKRFKGGSR